MTPAHSQTPASVSSVGPRLGAGRLNATRCVLARNLNVPYIMHKKYVYAYGKVV